MKSLKQYFSKYYLPTWIVLMFDLTMLFFSWITAFFIRFGFDLSRIEASFDPLHFVIIFPLFFLFQWKFRSYSGLLRHCTIKDVIGIIFPILYAGIILVLVSQVSRQMNLSLFKVIPFSVIIIFLLLVSTVIVVSRLIAKMVFQKWIDIKKDTQNIMIFGAGRLGQTTLNALLMGSSVKYKVVGFIDDNNSLYNKYLSGIPIYSVCKAFKKIIPESKVVEIIFAIDNSKITNKRKREIADKCLSLQLLIKEVPPINTWINGELKAKSIRPIKIEDLLGRNSIQLDRKKIELGLKNSIVLVTGAAGSIGSEIVRQLIDFNVQRVIMLDKAESDLYNLQQEIIGCKVKTDFEVIVGDVTNESTLRKVFNKFSPSIVFNAAAYKHVPLMEEFPYEAFRVNVGGNKILADLSIEFGVKKFVFISTDKAVNPTSVMGATKRISEIYIQSLAQSGITSTQFITTRFGNVLGSNGSVVPLFKKQIEKGGPITITHKDITRYFMTIPEACQLVLEAGFMGNGGEIFVFDMGEPIKIYDLAIKMISLSGFVPKRDIKIKIIGLRPGEKLYEELLDKKEELLQNTFNDKILIGKTRNYNLNIINKNITDLIVAIDELSCMQLVEKMKLIVPEFVSMNSHYSCNSPEVESTLIGQLNYFKQKAREIEHSYNEVKELKKGKMIPVS